MKKILLMSAAAAALIFASCSKEIGGNDPDRGSDTGIAYVSIRVEAQVQGRASSETDASAEENSLKKLYLITFDATGRVVAVPDGDYYSMIDVSSLSATAAKSPDAVKISSSSKNLMVIANPGTGLLNAINDIDGRSTFTTFNKAVVGVTTADIMGSNGFAMITGGDETGKAVNDKILVPYVPIGNIHIVTGTDASADAAAKTEAEKPENRLKVKLERLASKLIVKKGSTVDVKDEAKFDLKNWTVDAVNGRYYPYAEKTLIAVAHNNAADYAKNFYTKDPNHLNAEGVVYGDVAPIAPDYSYAPILPWTDTANPNGYYGWKAVDATAYVIENTMDAPEQKFGNATRIVMKATYAPKDFPVDTDWFSWAGTNYKTLTDLKKAYAEADASTALKNACDAFYGKIKDYYGQKGRALGAADFASLTESEISDTNVPNGGEVVKDGTNPVIRWYQKGLCYYYYEIRHDNDPNAGNMAFAKYGVVRNNWYNLTLNSVSGPGTPWYPDIDEPGPGDPDPKDPIDNQAGYLGITVQIGKWILWETGMHI